MHYIVPILVRLGLRQVIEFLRLGVAPLSLLIGPWIGCQVSSVVLEWTIVTIKPVRMRLTTSEQERTWDRTRT